MYHIAQNDPPCLRTVAQNSEIPPWSETFHSFVEQCLRKDPQQRLSTNACLAVCFSFPNIYLIVIFTIYF
jgi:serine/threonine protein kinase